MRRIAFLTVAWIVMMGASSPCAALGSGPHQGPPYVGGPFVGKPMPEAVTRTSDMVAAWIGAFFMFAFAFGLAAVWAIRSVRRIRPPGPEWR